MKIEQHTQEHQPTLMRDVFDFTTGQRVQLSLHGGHTVSGKLESYNGYLLHVREGRVNYYVSDSNVISVRWEEQ